MTTSRRTSVAVAGVLTVTLAVTAFAAAPSQPGELDDDREVVVVETDPEPDLQPGIAGTPEGEEALYGGTLPDDAAEAVLEYHGEEVAGWAEEYIVGFGTDPDDTQFFAYHQVPVSPVSASTPEDVPVTTVSLNFGDPLCSLHAAQSMTHIWQQSWGSTYVEPVEVDGADYACQFGPDDRDGPTVTVVRVADEVWNPDGCDEFNAEEHAQGAPPIWPDEWWHCDDGSGDSAQTGWRDNGHTYWATCSRPDGDPAFCDGGVLRTFLLHTTSYVAGSQPEGWASPPVDPMVRYAYGL